MISLDNFKVTCNVCNEEGSIGVSDIYDGDAVIFAYCDKCRKAEVTQTIIRDIEEQVRE